MQALAHTRTQQRLVLSGPPGVGKSSVAEAVAASLGRESLDLDALITRRVGQSPAQILDTDGEARLRDLEVETLVNLDDGGGVLALGGGTLTDGRARSAARRLGPVLGLTAPVPTLRARLARPHNPRRPLLDGGLEPLIEGRARSYRAVDASVEAEGDLGSVAARVIARAEGVRRIEATVGAQRTRVLVGTDLVDAPAGALAHLEPKRPVLVICDAGVPEAAREARLAPLRAQLDLHEVIVPGGEQVKTWAFAGDVLERALGAGCGRQSAVLAIGGGATCDLAGLVSHLLGRGAPLVLVPSTLLAQVDASVGGKCAVNMAAGRNLAGAFHPASDVIVDLALLQSLPEAEARSGLAELLKIAIVSDAALFDAVLTDGATASTVASGIARKAEIVARDPFEADERRHLNLGHTLGHALESASEHELRHGEAVAIGIAAIARLSAEMNLCTEDVARRVIEGLSNLDLPTHADADLLRRAADFVGADKKSAAGEAALVCIHAVASVSVQTLPLAEACERLVRHGGHR